MHNFQKWFLTLFAVLLLVTSTASRAATPSPDIEAVIDRVEQSRGVVFYRNGSAHSAVEAAAHLRRKLRAAHGRITTVEQFIDHIGTRSSLTGIAYRVRLADGREIDSGQWLYGLLREVRAGRLKPAPAGQQVRMP